MYQEQSAAKFTSNPSFLCWAVFLLSMAVVSNYPVPGWLNHHQLGKSAKGNETLQGWGPAICVFNKPPSNSDWLPLLSQDAWAQCPIWDANSDSGLWPICPSGNPSLVSFTLLGQAKDHPQKCGEQGWWRRRRLNGMSEKQENPNPLGSNHFFKSGFFNVAWVLMPEMHQVFLFWHLAN